MVSHNQSMLESDKEKEKEKEKTAKFVPPVRVKSKMKVHTPNPEKVETKERIVIKKRDSSNIKTLEGKRFSSVALTQSKKSIGLSPSQA